MLNSSANCGVIAQRHKGLDDEVGGFRCTCWVGRNQKISQAVKVAPGARGDVSFRHFASAVESKWAQLALRVRGGLGLAPATFAFKYRLISSSEYTFPYLATSCSASNADATKLRRSSAAAACSSIAFNMKACGVCPTSPASACTRALSDSGSFNVVAIPGPWRIFLLLCSQSSCSRSQIEVGLISVIRFPVNMATCSRSAMA